MRFKPKSAARTPRDRDGVFARRASAAEHSPPTPVRQGDRAASLGRRADAQTLVDRADHAARHSSFQKAIMQNPPNSSGSFGFIFMNRHWPSIRRIKLADNRRGVVIGSIESASAAVLGSAHAASASPSRRRPASPRIESTGAGHAASRTPHGAWRMARVACRVSRVACRVSRVACRVSRVACRVSRVACRVSHVACRVSRVACRVSRVACRVSRVACRVSRVACRVSRVAGGASPGCAAREAHASTRARRAVSAPPGSRVPEPRDIGRPHRGAPLFHPTTRVNVSTSAICPMSTGSRSDVDHPAASGARCPKTSIRHLPPAHEATRAARAAHACAHMDSPARARGELRACRAPRARPPCRSSSRRAGRSAPAAPRRARRRRPRAASPCLARPIRSCPSGRPDKRPRSDRG
ncbi:glycogen branching protein [Burkholderia pseudomallei]|nr:glycogen branching protein [Burkholderia pseudomallei]